MDVTCPSGLTLTFRDRMMRGDVREAKRGIKVVIQPDGTRSQDGSFLDDIAGRVVKSMLTAWSSDQPLPRAAATDELAQGILDRVLDDRDWAHVKKAIGPWIESALDVERPDVFVHVPTGVKVLPAGPDDEKALDANPDFARVSDTDPKSESDATAISS